MSEQIFVHGLVFLDGTSLDLDFIPALSPPRL